MSTCLLPVLPQAPVAEGKASCTRYIARQPILDREQNTRAYELLFRSGPQNFFGACDPEAATCSVIDSFLLSGFAQLTGGHLAFINCTRNALLLDLITLLPPERVVVELLENVPADEEVLDACDRLRRAGYRIALDDYVPTPDTLRLLRFTDIVKVDFLATDAVTQAAIASDMRRRCIHLVAEKVETREQVDFAQRLGYHYFQGYFFRKPEILTLKDLPCSKLASARLLSTPNPSIFRTSSGNELSGRASQRQLQ